MMKTRLHILRFRRKGVALVLVLCLLVLLSAMVVAFFSTTSSTQRETALYENFIKGGWVDALLLVRTRVSDSRVELARAAKLPFVTYGRTETAEPYAWVDTDNEKAFYLATLRQIDFGHRRIALLNGPLEYAMDDLTRLAERPLAFIFRYVRHRAPSHVAIVSAVLAAVACSITTQYGVKYLIDALAGGSHAVWVAFAIRSTMAFCSCSSGREPTRGIMTSGKGFLPSRRSSQAASKIACACISVISGKEIPKRQPR